MLPPSSIIIFCVGILCFVTIAFLIRKYMRSREHFVSTSPPPVHVMSSMETRRFLENDVDGYVRSMSSYDLIARKATTHSEYISRISQNTHDASPIETRVIEDAVKAADAFIAKQSNMPDLYSIPWKIALTKNKAYEEGLPHTRSDIIFIDQASIKDRDIVTTLLHEKVHVYQRMYPGIIDTWLQRRGYTRVAPRSTRRLVRANPDIDGWIYKDPKSNMEMVATYNSERPSSISDVTISNYSFEHPYEYMAYEFAATFNA
jgi:hypothetical protein